MAYSGGRDSTALLHATVRAARVLGIDVVALHVHHGISARADDWLRHGAAMCASWARRGDPVRFIATRLTTRPIAGESIEAWARRERYRALRAMAMAHGADLVLLAHHRRDQAETFLLQALRAGDVASLSAMPSSALRDAVRWARPWLATPAAAVHAYACTHRLRHVEDDTNGDLRFARNRLRAQVWPALIDAFPDAEATLAIAATHAQVAAATVDSFAATDQLLVARDGGIDIAAWRTLPSARRGHALRAWLRPRLGAKATTRHLIDRLATELDEGKTRRWPLDGAELRSYRGTLRHCVIAAAADAQGGAGPAVRIDLHRAGTHRLDDWAGAFVVARVAQDGLSTTIARQLDIRARLPGDRFQAGPNRPPRSLKLQYQAAGVPQWLRTGPIVCFDGIPVYVPGLGIDARAVASPGEPCVGIDWRPD